MSDPTLQGFRLSPQQRQIWNAQTGSALVAVCEISLLGKLRADLLHQSLRTLVGRHEILRTTFRRPAGVKLPFQVISETASVDWQEVDLSNYDSEQQRVALNDLYQAEQEIRFNLEALPLLRSILAKLTDDSHVLILSLPALCADSLSLSILIDELASLYAGGFIDDGDEPLQYADFAAWQNELLESDTAEAQKGKSFWVERSSASGSIFLPLEIAKTGKEFRSDCVSVVLGEELSTKLELMAQQRDVGLRAVLLTCWLALLERITNQESLAIHVLCHNRKLEEVQSAIGAFSQYLPMVAPSASTSFTQSVKQVSDSLGNGEELQEYYDGVDINWQELVGFELVSLTEDSRSRELLFSTSRQEVKSPPFKLKLVAIKTQNALRLALAFKEGVIEAATVARIAGYYQRMLRAFAETFDVPSDKVTLVDDAELKWLLDELNQTSAPYSRDKCIHELFALQVQRAPEAVAIVSKDERLTYRELNRQANQLAHLLRSEGVGRGACVGLCVERSAAFFVSLLGIMKAGASYVPLNPEHPTARLALQLQESAAQICITNKRQTGASFGDAFRTIDLSAAGERLTQQPESDPEVVNTPDDLVYVIYTSGSTGMPKGVGVRHRNLVNYTEFIISLLELDSAWHFATVSTPTADLGNTSIFPAWLSGGCLHAIDHDTAMEGNRFADYLEKHHIDVLKIVPSHLQALYASSEGRNVLPQRALLLGGEALSWKLAERILNETKDCRVFNHYGPTETTVGSLTFRVTANRSPYAMTVPIGRPIANTKAYVLDRLCQVVPIGVPGELYLGGSGVSAGYLNQPEETAARFISNPFDTPDDRLYRTGDLVRYLPDGNIEFLGRVDHQVKIRGFRVELGEIEAALGAYKQVRQAAVVLRKDEEKIVAYVVRNSSSVSVEDLRQWLKTRLPDYMIPAAFVFLKNLPLNANGKIDRAALPDPDELSQAQLKSFVAPRSSTEREVAAIWADVLKLERIGINDNFFELGGHSLIATQVISRMRKSFQQELPLRSIFESPTVAELAAAIELASKPSDAALLEALNTLERLSDEEAERLLSLEQQDPEERAFEN